MSDGGESRYLSFMQAIGYIKSYPEDQKINVPGDYYAQLHQNDVAFDHMLTAEEEVTTETIMLSGNDAKIVRSLKASDIRALARRVAGGDKFVKVYSEE